MYGMPKKPGKNQQRLLAAIEPDSGILDLQAGEDVKPAFRFS